jgi:Holliday junction resolvasome RuvABC endonuclease subunit
MVKILGIDPSLRGTGLALLEVSAPHVYEWLTVDVLSNKLTEHSRLNYIVSEVRDILSMLSDGDLVVMEGAAFSSGGRNSHMLAGLWWLIRHQIYISQSHTGQKHCMIVPPTSRAKYATGKGNAKKDMVVASAKEMFSEELVIDDNAADAMFLAAMGARYISKPIDNFGEEQIDRVSAFAKVDLPDVT